MHKENFFSLIALVEQNIIVIKVHELEPRNQIDQKLLGLILEELD